MLATATLLTFIFWIADALNQKINEGNIDRKTKICLLLGIGRNWVYIPQRLFMVVSIVWMCGILKI
jgi:hypothetical protein